MTASENTLREQVDAIVDRHTVEWKAGHNHLVSEQPMPDYADNRCVICGALATTEYEHEPSCGKPSCEYQIQESIDAIGDIGAK